MFTGIIEGLGIINRIQKEGENLHFTVECEFTNELKIDQSLAHNGVCLTVVDIQGGSYVVTAIEETLQKTNLNFLSEGDEVNLERCMRLGDRLDGHIVQGHVDQIGKVKEIEELDGSWKYTIEYNPSLNNITVEKGSVTVNGTSLTVVDSGKGVFSVCIIPYTYNYTTFKNLREDDVVNIEFDVVGKYIAKLHRNY
ncbi:MAG: riboflavin synthase [Flavobacteriales bacterium]|nr:riboflavin synthase [Flavobacteriales bacterium]|tara:strand:- start:7971 stop:8558 length:588 start_codon:yes stop_codon:yes gene_type:complete